jgi:septation ring formation regulator EzrA
MAKYVDEADSLADQMTDLDKQVVAVGEQIKSLNIDTEDLTPIKNDIVTLQTSIAGIDIVALQTSIAAINASIDSMYDDVKSLKNKNDNPLAN